MRKKTTRIILIIIIILTILLFVVFSILKSRLSKIKKSNDNSVLSEENFDYDEEPGVDEEYEEDDYTIDKSQYPAETEQEGLRDALYTEKPREVTSSIYFSTVKNIIETFLKDIGEMNNKQFLNKTDEYGVSNSDLRKKTYDRLTKTYLKKNEIEIDNISQKLRMPYTYFSLNIKKMIQYAIKNNPILRFAVCIEIKDEDVDVDEDEDEEKKQDDKKNVKTNNFIVYLDYENQSFAIEPVGSKNIEDVKLDAEIAEIEKNVNNTYTYLNEE